jgi:hypothetical protein
MNGKVVGGSIVIAAIIAGAALYYTQVYAYYFPVKPGEPGSEMRLVSLVSHQPEPILADDLQAIDANSSPLRFRACFETPQSLALLSETYVGLDKAVPLTGPDWFACYDAVAIGEALERGEALAFLSEPDIHPGVDRVIAVFPDGRAFAWHQLNDKAE